MIRSSLATKRIGFSGRVQGFTLRASKKPEPVLRFMQQVYVRVKTNRIYRMRAEHDLSFNAIRSPENWLIFFRIIPHQGLHWAEIKVAYENTAPRLFDLDKIKDELLGQAAYSMIVFRPTVEPSVACIIHCLEDTFKPIPRALP